MAIAAGLIVAAIPLAYILLTFVKLFLRDDEVWQGRRDEKRREREDRKNLRFLSAWKWDILDGLIESGIIPADEDGFIAQEYVKKYELFWTWARKNLIK